MLASNSTTSGRFPPGLTVAGVWSVGRKIGSGSFGEIYHGTHIESGREAAMKFEKCKSKHPQLLYEAKLLRRLQGGEGVAQLFYSGVVEVAIPTTSSSLYTSGGMTTGEQETTESYNVMITELLGPTLEDLFSLCDRKFHPHTVLFIMDEMLRRVEYLHSSLFIHRDIKPENFLIGRGEKANTVFMIDYGLAKRYCDPRTGEHIPYREDKSLTGTARYASINAHLGIEQSRRDDLEAAGYVMLYLARGGILPWQGLRASKKQEKYKLIMEKKLGTPVEVLCQNQPREFSAYLRYCHALRFTDIPDYAHLRRLLQSIRVNLRLPADAALDWVIISGSRSEVARRLRRLGYPTPTQASQQRRAELTDKPPNRSPQPPLPEASRPFPFASLFQKENQAGGKLKSQRDKRSPSNGGAGHTSRCNRLEEDVSLRNFSQLPGERFKENIVKRTRACSALEEVTVDMRQHLTHIAPAPAVNSELGSVSNRKDSRGTNTQRRQLLRESSPKRSKSNRRPAPPAVAEQPEIIAQKCFPSVSRIRRHSRQHRPP